MSQRAKTSAHPLCCYAEKIIIISVINNQGGASKNSNELAVLLLFATENSKNKYILYCHIFEILFKIWKATMGRIRCLAASVR